MAESAWFVVGFVTASALNAAFVGVCVWAATTDSLDDYDEAR